MEATLHTKRGTKIEEVLAIRYYKGNRKPASLLCLTDRHREEEFMVQDLFPEDERERVIKEMEEG